MYERLEAQLAAFIEKLEALRVCFLELSANKTEKFVLYDDLRATIEQEKSKISTSEPVGVVECDYYPDGFPKGQWGNLTQSFMIAEGTLLYTSPQPTPLNVIDAERWRWFIENWGEPHVEQAIDQAMKSE